MDNRSADVLQRKAKTIRYLKDKVTQKSLDTSLNNAIQNKCFPAFIEIFLQARAKPESQSVERALNYNYPPKIIHVLIEKAKMASQTILTAQEQSHVPFKLSAKKEQQSKENEKIFLNLLSHSDFQVFPYEQVLTRIEFERTLESIKLDSSQEEPPSCFISYAWRLTPHEEELKRVNLLVFEHV